MGVEKLYWLTINTNMPRSNSKLKKEFQMDDDDNAIVPVEDVIVRPSVLKEKVKRPMSEKQRENVAKLVEVNRAKWNASREAKEKEKEAEKERIREEVRADIEAKLKAGTHARAKVVKSGQGPKPKPKGEKKPEPIQEETPTETEPDTTEAEESEDELPPRRAVRQARRQMKTLAKIDEVIQEASNPYMAKLAGRWR
jgi:hypothetical protein